ncbi:MAG: prepilin-type N-terminal cleavage/methylation domain-containing protein [Actinomycetota bacterium]
MNGQRGFTLVELLVVILIIAILAAVAIPIFLRQREKAWEDQAIATLRDAATAQESFRTEEFESDGVTPVTGYTTDEAELVAQGWKNPSYGDLTVDSATGNAYCLDFDHSNLPDPVDYHFDSEDGLARGAC